MPITSIAPAQAAGITGLFALWALLLFGGFFLGRPNAQRTRHMPTWTRMASSLCLVAIGWLWLPAVWHTQIRAYAWAVAIGMTLGAVGDLILAGLLPVSPPVLWGMAAFGLGHVAYIRAFLGLGTQCALAAAGPHFGAWAAWLGIGLAGWYVAVFRGQRAGALHWAALPYALLLASTAGVASGLALQTPLFVPAALGGGLFLLSDLILAGRLFGGLHLDLIDDIVWLTYGPAQALIVCSVVAALRLASSA